VDFRLQVTLLKLFVSKRNALHLSIEKIIIKSSSKKYTKITFL
jgi:hypothetical protein